MKNQVKITATKGQVNNTAVTAKDAIRSAVASNDTAIKPNNAFDQVNAEDLAFTSQTAPTIVVADPTKAEIITESPTAEPTKMEIKEELRTHKPALSLEQTLKLVKELAERTAHRDTYIGYINSLINFVVSQQDDDMGKKDDPSFKGCELRIKDGEGNVFVTSSASVIFGTVEFMKARFSERLAEVESEIVIPL